MVGTAPLLTHSPGRNGPRIASVLAAVGCLLAAAGCDRGPTAPAAAPAGPSHIKGQVIDALLRGLGEATVEVLDGPNAGMKAVSNAKGEFGLVTTAPAHRVNLRASKEGYQPVTTGATWTPPGVTLPPVVLRLPGFESYDALEAGAYTLTIAFDIATARTWLAEAPCSSYPGDLTSRTYDITVSAAPAGVRQVGITSLPGGPNGPWYGFPLFVAGDRVVLGTGEEGIPEDLPEFRFLTVWPFVSPANPSAITVGSSISFPVSTEFRYCQLKSPRGIYNDCSQVPGDQRLAYHSCLSDDAVMTFTRR